MFYIGLKILALALAIFFTIFFYACLLWTERFKGGKPGQKKNIKVALISAFIVSVLYTFKFFLIGVVVVAIISIFLR